MADQFPFHIFPQRVVSLPSAEVEASLSAHQVTFDFYQEVRLRAAFEEHCQWYQRVAQQHRRDLRAMQQEPNLLGWFRRGTAN
jgi:hypothetical protein